MSGNTKTIIWNGPEGFIPGHGRVVPGKEKTLPATLADQYIAQKQASPKRAGKKSEPTPTEE